MISCFGDQIMEEVGAVPNTIYGAGIGIFSCGVNVSRILTEARCSSVELERQRGVQLKYCMSGTQDDRLVDVDRSVLGLGQDCQRNFPLGRVNIWLYNMVQKQKFTIWFHHLV
jgi:hypothetical protein